MNPRWTTLSNAYNTQVSLNYGRILAPTLIYNATLTNTVQSFLSSSTASLYAAQNQSLLTNYLATQNIISPQITRFILILLVSIMVFMTVSGNLLVIIVFMREATIRTYSNYFILNLSIADFLIGLIWYVRKFHMLGFLMYKNWT